MTTSETFATRNDPVQIRTADGCRLAVRRFGPEDAPPVLLLAGHGGGMQRWRGILPELRVDEPERELFAAAGCVRSLAEHLRVVVFDARGTGWSSRSHGVAATPKEAAADALAVAAALFGGPFHLAGHSLGCCVALEAALAERGRVKTLALISATATGEGATSPGTGSPVPTEAADDLPADSIDQQDDLQRRLVAEAFSPGYATAHPELAGALIGEALLALRWDRRLRARGARSRQPAAARTASFALPEAARLGTLAVPSLVIHGRQDRLAPPANAEYLARHIPGSRLELLEGGHELPIERAGDLIDAVHRLIIGSALH